MKYARILCVDDEPKVLEGLERILHRKCVTLTATSGEEALRILAGPEHIEVIVSDMRMPEMNGATLLAEFRKRSPDTVRLLLTGQADVESAIHAVNEGQVFRFLTKPCPAPQFLDAVSAAVERHRHRAGLDGGDRVGSSRNLGLDLATTRARSEDCLVPPGG